MERVAMSSAPETYVPISPFAAAFFAGLAGPATLYAATPNYAAFTQVPSPAASFSLVGAYLIAAGGAVEQEKELGDRSAK
jgi:hypothetical protein